ncbi:MAG: Hsp70 family protein [Oscillospiraceae bacterium]|jgi:molecular chaperone DnaK|nr:Hsp70 family protein [Oscillospiraceae bacterium]
MIIGIDLGTTFSVAAYIKDGTPTVIRNLDNLETTPSVVWFDDSEIIVGSQAKSMRKLEPYNVIFEIKKHMGEINKNGKEYIVKIENGNEYRPEEISAIILKAIKNFCENSSRLNEEITGCVITVPANFNDAQKKATLDAANIAGLNVLGLINEPTAAALAYSYETSAETEQTILVYDLGGGTFDITILKINGKMSEVLSTDGDLKLGGVYFDTTLFQYISMEFKRLTGLNIEETDDDKTIQDIWDACERAKVSLSTREKCQIPISIGGQKAKIDITRNKFEELIKSFLDDTIIRIENAIIEANLTAEDIDNVLLVGGSTQIPIIAKMLEEMFKKPPLRTVNPDLAVAMGAAIYADWLSKNKEEEPIIKDVIAHSLGTTARNENGNKINDIIIYANTQVPCKKRRIYSTNDVFQDNILLTLNEGNDTDLDYVRVVGNTKITIPSRSVKYCIGIELGYDENGIIICESFDLYNQNEDLWEKDIGCIAPSLGKLIPARNANLTSEQVENSKQRLTLESVQ